MFSFNMLVHISCLVARIPTICARPAFFAIKIRNFYHLVLHYTVQMILKEHFLNISSQQNMLFPVSSKSFSTIKSLRAKLTRQGHTKMLPLDMSVKVRCFLIAVRTISALPNFVSITILDLLHLALYFNIIIY